jgi:hypothetical protein
MDAYLRDNSWFIPSNGKDHYRNRDRELREGKSTRLARADDLGVHAAPAADLAFSGSDKRDETAMVEKV